MSRLQRGPGRARLQRIHGQDRLGTGRAQAFQHGQKTPDFLILGNRIGVGAGRFRPEIEHSRAFVEQAQTVFHGHAWIKKTPAVGKGIGRHVDNPHQTEGGRAQRPPPSKNPCTFCVHALFLKGSPDERKSRRPPRAPGPNVYCCGFSGP